MKKTIAHMHINIAHEYVNEFSTKLSFQKEDGAFRKKMEPSDTA